MIGGDDSALRSIFPSEPLDDLISPFAPLGIDHLDARTMLTAFNRLSSLPTIEDHGQRMTSPVAVPCQEPQQRFTRHLRMRTRPGVSSKGQQIVPVDNHMHAGEKPYDVAKRAVNLTQRHGSKRRSP